MHKNQNTFRPIQTYIRRNGVLDLGATRWIKGESVLSEDESKRRKRLHLGRIDKKPPITAWLGNKKNVLRTLGGRYQYPL